MSDEFENEELLKEFLTESFELIEAMDDGIMEFEKNLNDKDALDAVFRVLHSLKGASSFFGLKHVEGLAHKAENVLGLIQKDCVEPNQEIVTLMLESSDKLKDMLEKLSNGDDHNVVDCEELKQKLTEINEEGLKNSPKPKKKVAKKVEKEKSERPMEEKTNDEEDKKVKLELVQEEANKESEKKEEDVQIFVANIKKDAPVQNKEDKPQEKKEVAPPVTPEVSKKSSPTDSNIRIQVSLIDKLMNLVSELVLTKNQMQQIVEEKRDQVLISTCQKLGMVTSELQENIMKTRMQPVHNVWAKFPRIVRDLSISIGKKIRLDMVGQDTELDRSLIESIKDPLTHIIRNAVDHGIETPEERKNSGKEEEGRVLLKAYQQSGQVVIEISDDGRGLHIQKISDKIVNKGLASREEVEGMSDRKVYNYIFHPGFSTAEKVTNISGRGVGMDVVRTNIEAIGGVVDLESKYGEGTVFKIKIPLTLAIIPALVVMNGSRNYVIPQSSINGLIRLKGEEIKKIENIQGIPVYRLRGDLIPIIYLSDCVQEPRKKEEEDFEDSKLYIVIVRVENERFGLVVDKIKDHQEIVVKPMGSQLKDIEIYAGASIIGNGDIALILDTAGIAKEMVSKDTKKLSEEKSEDDGLLSGDGSMYLMVEGPNHNRMAIEYESVIRLEKVERKSIESLADRDVLKYRGSILQLIYLSKFFNIEDESHEESLNVVIYNYKGEEIGIVVNKIMDIVTEEIKVKKENPRKGVKFLALLQKETTEILDVDKVVEGSKIFEENTKTQEERMAA